MPKEDRAKAAEKKKKEEEKRVETETRENKNIFRRIFDRLPEGVKNFIRGIRDVMVTAVNRIAFGKEGNRKVQNYAASRYIKELKEKEELNSGEKGDSNKGAPNTSKENQEQEENEEQETGIVTGEIAEDETELEGIEKAAEQALGEQEKVVIPQVRFATLSDLKELDKSLGDTEPKHELKKGKGSNSHIFYYKDNGEELARISLCPSTENVPPEKVLRAGDQDQTKVVKLFVNGKSEFYSLAGATAYVNELINLEKAQEARLPEFGLYKGLQEKITDRDHSEIVEINGKYHLYLYATEDRSVAPYAAVSITNPKGVLKNGVECSYKITRPDEVGKEYSNIYPSGNVRFNDEKIGEEVERVRKAYEERTKEKEVPEASAEKQAEEKAVVQQTQSGQVPDTTEVTRIVAYNKAAYDKALTRALKTHQDLDIKLASTDFYVQVRNGKIVSNDQPEKTENPRWDDKDSFINTIKSKIENSYKGKDVADSFAYGDYQIDFERKENIATISFTAGGEIRTFILDSASKDVFKNEIASAISKGKEWMAEKVAGACEVKYEGEKDVADKSAIGNKDGSLDANLAEFQEAANEHNTKVESSVSTKTQGVPTEEYDTGTRNY